MKNALSALLIVGAGTLVSFADSETYDTGYPSSYYTRSAFNLHELKLSGLDLTGSSATGSPSGYYTLSSIGYLMNSSANTFASAVAIVSSTDWTVLAVSSSYSTETGQTFGSESNKAIATYSFSSQATLDASATYYVIALSSTDGISVGETYTGTNMTTIASSGGNPMSLSGTSSALAYTVSWSDTTPTLTAYSQDGSQLNATYQVVLTAVAVPEPSAFGLLAGLGALAFVASRRRRRSRNAA